MQRSLMRRLPWLGSTILVVMGLAACGVTPAVGASPSAPTPIATVAGSGCPQGAPTALPWGQPTQVITSLTDNQQISIVAGQTFEIALAFGRQWALAPVDSPSLTLDQPTGYTDTTTKQCIWHFSAKTAGSVLLIYQSSVICAPHTPCPGVIAETKVTILVK